MTTMTKFKEWNFAQLREWGGNNEAIKTFDAIRHAEMPNVELMQARQLLRDEFNQWCSTEVKDVNGKQPIVNGSVNKHLSIEEMKQFSAHTKIRLIHNLQVSWQFHHSFENAYIIPADEWIKISCIFVSDNN